MKRKLDGVRNVRWSVSAAVVAIVSAVPVLHAHLGRHDSDIVHSSDPPGVLMNTSAATVPGMAASATGSSGTSSGRPRRAPHFSIRRGPQVPHPQERKPWPPTHNLT